MNHSVQATSDMVRLLVAAYNDTWWNSRTYTSFWDMIEHVLNCKVHHITVDPNIPGITTQITFRTEEELTEFKLKFL